MREHELTPERVLGGVPGGARRGEGLTPDLREAAPHLQEAAPDLQEVTPDLQEDSQWYVSTVLNSEAAPSVETLGVRVCANSTPAHYSFKPPNILNRAPPRVLNRVFLTHAHIVRTSKEEYTTLP